MKNRSAHGFTLIELLIVIAIIAILAAGIVVLINPVNVFQKARDTQRKNDLRQIQTALELYYQDKGYYPLPKGAGACTPSNCASNSFSDPTDWINLTGYMTLLPKDPLNKVGAAYAADGNYTYTYHVESSQLNAARTGTKSYSLMTQLQNKEDPQACAKLSSPYTMGSGVGTWCSVGGDGSFPGAGAKLYVLNQSK